MQRLTLTLVTLLAAGGLRAQSGSVSPAFFADIEGSTSSAQPFAVGRAQQVHGDLRGAPAVLGGLAFRRDGVAPDDPRYQARDVVIELRMAESDLATLSAGFAANYATPPQTVLPAGAVRLPDRTARPASRPGPFDVRLPFAQPFAYTGLADLLWESIVTRGPSAPYPSDTAVDDASVTVSSLTRRGSGCTTQGTEFRFEVSADTQSITGRPQVTWLYQGTGVPAFGGVAIAFGVGDPDLLVPGLCGRLRVAPLVLLPVTVQPGGVFRAVQTTPLSRAPVGQPFELQAVAFGGGAGALSNGVTLRVNPPAPRFAISGVTAADPTALRGSVRAGRAIVVEWR